MSAGNDARASAITDNSIPEISQSCPVVRLCPVSPKTTEFPEDSSQSLSPTWVLGLMLLNDIAGWGFWQVEVGGEDATRGWLAGREGS